MLLSVHIPKCAGTSFRAILQQIFAERLWLNYGVIFNRGDAQRVPVPAGVECIHGHFEADAFSEIFPNATLITWVRHPVERLVSNYHYFRRCPGDHDFFSRILNEKGLNVREFADLEGMQNVASRHFSGRKLADFKFVGVTERFADSMSHFGRTLGVESFFTVPYLNFNPERTTAQYELSRADFDYIAERNSADLAFYEGAQRVLDASMTAANLTRSRKWTNSKSWRVI